MGERTSKTAFGETRKPFFHKHSGFDTIPEQYQEVKEKTTELYGKGKDTVLSFIEDKPLTSLLIAGGVGFVLSLFAMHKKD